MSKRGGAACRPDWQRGTQAQLPNVVIEQQTDKGECDVKAYQVRSGDDTFGPYIWQGQARSHVNHLEELNEKWPEHAEPAGIEEVEVERLSSQEVDVIGSVVGYQFSRTTNGHRVVRRAVRNLRWVRDHAEAEGEIIFYGRRVLVRQTEYFMPWRTVKLLPDEEEAGERELPDTVMFPAGAIATCNRSHDDNKHPLPRAMEGVRENRNAYRLREMCILGCGHLDGHWVFLSDNPNVSLEVEEGDRA